MKRISRLTALLMALLLIFQMTAVATEMSSEDIYVEPTPIPQENLDADILMQLSNDAAEVAAAIDTVRGMGVTANQDLIPLRDYPNLIWGEKIAELPTGTFVVVYDTMGSGIISGDWYKVCYNGQDGYIHSSLLNVCACNVQEGAGLDAHADGCPDKMYYVSICALTAEEIAANWSEYTEEGKAFILLYLSWHDQVKLAALQALIGPPLVEDTLEAEEYGVAVSGMLPEGATLKISNDIPDVAEDIVNAGFGVENGRILNWSASYDIKIMNGDVQWQPNTDLQLTIGGVNKESFEEVEVTHFFDSAAALNAAIEAGTARKYTASGIAASMPTEAAAAKQITGEEDTVYYEVLSTSNGKVQANSDGSITFSANSFSVYRVNAMFTSGMVNAANPSGSSVADGSTVNIGLNEKLFLYWYHSGIKDGNYDNFGIIHRGNWKITSGDDIVKITTYDNNRLSCTCGMPGGEHLGSCPVSEAYALRQYWYVVVEGLQPGEAIITFDCVSKDTSTDTWSDISSHSFKIIVSEEAFYIDNQIAENGCLVPVANEAIKQNVASYRWTKTKKGSATTLEIDEKALSELYVVENGVNIAVDNGGIFDDDRMPKVYTVEALDASGKVVTYEEDGTTKEAKASFTVEYGNELLNTGFETPVVTRHPDTSHHQQYANGTPGLYWKTSGTGSNTVFTQDIEITQDFMDVRELDGSYVEFHSGGNHYPSSYKFPRIGSDPSDPNNSKLTANEFEGAASGNQWAELNCEAYGALYQDVLTEPGASLNFSFAHRGRANVLSTDYAGTENLAHGDGSTPYTLSDLYKLADYMVDNFSPQGLFDINRQVKEVTINGKSYTVYPDHMDELCVIIMAADDAEYFITEESIYSLFLNSGANMAPDGVVDTNGRRAIIAITPGNYTITVNGKEIPYYITMSKATNLAWENVSGSYRVPEGQYLTRFFFAALYSGWNGNRRGGNFIDDTKFTEKLPYEIHYHLQNDDGTYQELDLIETGSEMIGEVVSAKNTGDTLLANTALEKATLNGVPYSGGTSFSVINTQASASAGKIILDLYYIKKGLSVSKVVEGVEAGYAGMDGYSVTFNVYSDANCTTKVGTATVDLGQNQYTGSALVMSVEDTSEKFIPEANTTYYVQEILNSTIPSYRLINWTEKKSIAMGDIAAASLEFVNEYEKLFDLTIAKDGLNLSTDPHSSTMYSVVCEANNISMTVAIYGNSSVTIKDLPVGTYTVTELTDWSWRYDVTGSASETIVVDDAVNQVTFTNTRNKDKWLDSDCYAENRFTGSGATATINPTE